MLDGLEEGETLPPPAVDGLSATLSFEAAEATSASLELNGVPCVRAIVVEAHSRIAGAHLALSVEGHPTCDVLRPVDPIDAGITLAVDCEHLRLPLSVLRASTERTHVDIHVRLVSSEGSTVARATHRIAIAPETHWSGMATHCESLAAFVTPNSPAIAELLRDASARLKEKTGSGALDGYLSGNAARVQRIAESCYEALASRAISYVVLQASFEKTGQKVRTAADVLRDGLGNCLDLSVTLASLLEACGLWPMLVLGDEHATVAFATMDEHFADAVHEGATRLVNRRALGEVRVIEATALCGDPKSFGEALTVGERWLDRLSPASMVVDVRAARNAGFHPLPEVIARNERDDEAPVEPPERDYKIVQPADLPPLPKPKLTPRESRLESWKKKLLDLTLRNRLLNDRDAAGVPLVAEGDATIALLENILWDEKRLLLRARGAMREMTAEACEEELRSGTLRAQLDDAELFKRATKAYRDGKSSLEETGARSLYVALGALEFKIEQRAEPVRAPLVLVPVEMERISRSEGFRIKAVLDDTVPNVALVEYLRMTHGLDIGLAGQLAEDDRGIDLTQILARVRQSVKNVPGARVLATAKLGTYSFKKLPLFEEMRLRGKELSAHPIVATLLERNAPTTVRDAKLLDPTEVDQAARFESVRLPLPADSSQIAAVLSAAAGRTFVLQGPPGTGKSQTITNLLTECLARGKRVLFVAEKSAALEVVSERLRKTGLGAFALDLHADHATKTNFVTQVKDALEAVDARATAGAANFAQTAAQLDRTSARVASAGNALHASHRESAKNKARESATASAGLTAHGGLSAHRAIERALALSEGTNDAIPHPALVNQLDGSLPQDATSADLAQRVECVDRLVAAFDELPAESAADLADFEPTRPLSPEDATRLAQAARAATATLEALAEPARTLAAALGVPTPSEFGAMQAQVDLAMSIDMTHVAAAPLATCALAPDSATQLDARARAVELTEAAHVARTNMRARFDDAVLTLPLASLAGDLRAAREKFVLFRWLATRKVRAELVRLAKSPLPTALEDLLREIESLLAAKSAIDAAAPVAHDVRIFAVSQAGTDDAIDFAAARRAIESARIFARTARASMPKEVALLACSVPNTIRDGSLDTARTEAKRALEVAKSALLPLADLGANPPLHAATARLSTTCERLARVARAERTIPAWSTFTVARARAAEFRLKPVADALLSGALPTTLAESAAEAEMLAAWTREKLRSEPALLDCGADRMQELRKQLVAGMSEYRKGAAGAVALAVRDRARMALANADLPGMRQARMKIDELRALSTIRRPIRRVMSEAAPAMTAIKPIVLASPLSAATMLPPDFPPFDLIVFDEASQVPVWDAACAIARGTASVIVGDSRQLPPTNFFDRKDAGDAKDEGSDADRSANDAALADMLEPLESVLEEAIASGIPQRSLLWHYRSRDERLIEFSNRRSYGARLQTFPAARRAHPNLGVEFRFVGGVYDRAGTSTNRAEAEAVVAEITRRLLDDDACTANRSIGVVTFSVAQQTLVQDLLDEALDRDAKLRTRLAEAAEAGEDVFVKNLENVQGDERATMLFSICYGRDRTGALYHNFGPLNLSGGERRLNVAVSRAREKIVVFSSVRASELDPKKCTSKGAQDLRDYLAFAELGTVPASREETRAGMDIDVDAIERRLARALESRGFRVDFHVGRSRDYRVSLALALPEAPDEWILGVELDGAFHQTAPTVIDRELVRAGVLSSLGWRTIKVSAIDVLRDETKTVERIIAAARGT